MRILATSTIVAGALTATYWLVPDTAPNVAAWLMPSRMLNLTVITCMAIVLGLAVRLRTSAAAQATLGALVFLLLGLTVALGQAHDSSLREEAAWVAMACALPVLLWAGRPDLTTAPAAAWVSRVRPAVVRTLAVALTVVVVLGVIQFPARATSDVQDRTSEAFYRQVASRPGMLLTAFQLHLIQAPTRRAVLLDGLALDTLLYVPQAAPETDRILRRVYGTSLAASQRAHAGAILDEESNRSLWENRSADEWRALALEFGFTDILAYSTWTLQLPRVTEQADLTLYTVPPGPGD
jgi:hypothetical protein